MSELHEKVAVITGSTRGFGYATAKELLKAGANVVISGRFQETVDKTVESLSSYGNVRGTVCDVMIPEQVYSLGRFSISEFGRIDIWINNAGYTPNAGSITDFSPDEVLKTIKTNCLGVYNGTQTAMFYMEKRNKGTLVNIYGRGSNLQASSPSGLYASTKAWVTEFTRTLAQENKGSGIHIIAFSPGMMLTDMLDIQAVVGDKVKESMKSMPMVLKALGTPPSIPAAELVNLISTNHKEFIEYRWMRGMRAIRMIGKLILMQIFPKSRPPSVDYPQIEAFVPPIEDM